MGSSLGPLLAAIIIVPFGQISILYFSFLALLAIMLLVYIGKWYKQNIHRIRSKSRSVGAEHHNPVQGPL